MTRPKRPRDTNALAKMIVNLTTRTATEVDPDAGKDPAAIARGRAGGLKGGHSRASYVYYNFARKQAALKGTPAMAAGLADRILDD